MIDWVRIWETWQNCDKIAVSDDDRHYTYNEFAVYIGKFASFLQHHNVKKVIIKTPQGFESYAMIWACYLSDVTFCPIAETTPVERMNYFLSVFEPDLVVEDTVIFDDLFSTPPDQERFRANNFIETEHTAYVIFTSGSTGKPKGVRISRKGFENFLQWSVKEYGLYPGDIYGQYSSLGFDLSLMDIFTGLICGCTLVPIASPGSKLLPGAKIRKFKINFWHSIPTVIDLLSQSKQLNIEFLGSIRMISFCGEKLYPTQLAKLFEILPDVVVYNTYGPTEATVFCTYQRITRQNYLANSEESVSIGNPIPGYSIDLLKDDDGLGEIIITSNYIGQGYIGSEPFHGGFTPVSPFSSICPAYMTGDFAELVSAKLYFRGRRDSQVKIHGNRVDLSEVDYRLRELGCVAAATVFVQNKIISYVISPGKTDADLRLSLESFLPTSYLPAKIIVCDVFPYLKSGKVDIESLKKRFTYGGN